MLDIIFQKSKTFSTDVRVLVKILISKLEDCGK